MNGTPLKENVRLSVVAFYRVEADGLRTECIRDFGLNTNIAEQLLDVLPIVSVPFGWNVPKTTRFKAFWYDGEGWIHDPREHISPQDANRLLVVVDEAVADNGVESYKTLIKAVPAYKDFVDRFSSQARSHGVALSDIVSPEVSVMGVKFNWKKALDITWGWLKGRRKNS